MDGVCGWWGPGTFFHGGWAMGIGMLFWAFILFSILALLFRGFGAHRAGAVAESPLDILKRRLAAGEIDSDEFQRRRKLIEEPSPA